MALVRCTTPDGTSTNGDKSIPQGLILQESVKHLITVVQSLERRCAALETERDVQHATIAQLKASPGYLCNGTNGHVRNLSGYASSECSDGGEPEHVVKQEVTALATQLEHKLGVAEQIMSILRDGLHAETEDRKAVQASSDSKIKKLDDGLAALRIEMVEQRTEGRGEQKAQAAKESSPVPVSSNKLTEMDAKTTSLAKEVDSLKHIMQLRIKQHAKIDDCPTREGLYELYHLLDRDIFAADGERNGQFEGDWDELWHLRDRIVTRLAMFDMCGEAMKEAKNADVDLDI